MADFTLTQKAKADLKDIARFTQKRWGREQRNKYLELLDASFRKIARNPAMGRNCGEIKAGYHKFPTGSHVIYYRRSSGPTIEIICVLHESMDVETQPSGKDESH